MLVFAATSLMMAHLTGGWAYGVLIALAFGAFQGMYDTVSRAAVPRYVPEELRGTAYGAYHLVVGASMLAGLSIVGALWDALGRAVAFTYSACLALAGAALLYTTVIRTSA